MKSIGLFVFGLLFCYALQGQSLQSATINSSGSSSENSSALLTYTLGGVVTGTSSGSGTILTQGFSNPLQVVSLEENKEINLNARVFPVPATTSLTIELPVSEKAYQVILYKSMGSSILSRDI